MKKLIIFLVIPFVLTFCKNREVPPKHTTSDNSISPVHSKTPLPDNKSATKTTSPEKINIIKHVIKTAKKPEIKNIEPVIPKDNFKRATFFFNLGYGLSSLNILKKNKISLQDVDGYWLLRARSAYLTGNYNETYKSIKSGMALAKTDKEKYEFYLLRGRTNIRKNNLPAALRNLRKAVELKFKDKRAVISLLRVMYNLKMKTKMESLLQKALKEKPDCGEYLLAKADLMVLKRKRKDAIEYLKTIISNSKIQGYIRAKAYDRIGIMTAVFNKNHAKTILEECKKEFPSYGCVGIEMAITPPDPRHPNRKFKKVRRPGYKPKNPMAL